MNTYSKNPSNNDLGETENEISVREFIFKYFSYWRWFLISVILFLILGVFAFLSIERKYDIKAALLLKEDNSGSPAKGAMAGLADLGLFSTTSNVDNEIAVLSSPNVMKQTVIALGLENQYFEKGFFRKTEVYNDCPYLVQFKDLEAGQLEGSLFLELKKKDKIEIVGEYFFEDEKIKIEGSLDQLPGCIVLPRKLGRLEISYRPSIDEVKRNNTYIIHMNNPQKVAYSLVELLEINSTTKTSSVLNLNIVTGNIDKGVDILNEIVKKYNENNVKDNNEIAVNTSLFVDERLVNISSELRNIEAEVVLYKKTNSITDLGAEAKLFLENTSEIEQKKIDLELQLQSIDLIDEYVRKSENNFKIIPTLGILDSSLGGLVSNYNSLLLVYESLERSTTNDSPARIKALSDLNNIRESIIGAIVNQKKNLNISKKQLEKQSLLFESRIHSVPSQERDLLDIRRQQQIKQSLYLYLMQVKEETNIAMASTSAKAKVITDPVIPEKPKSPKRNLILLGCFLLGVALPMGVIYLKEAMQTRIVDRSELEKLSSVSVIGEIMNKTKKEGVLLMRSDATSPIVEMFRALRNNIQFILGSSDKKTLLVTSTIPGEGKTFISINLALSFSLLDKKVLLVGLDIRNPKLAMDIGFPKGIGLTSYLSGAEVDWRSLLVSLKDYPKLDVLQGGVIPPNPNELLMKPQLQQLLEEAKDIYDIVIIDSSPVGVISDTFLLAPYADTTIYVTRENVTPKRAIDFVNEVHNDKRLPNIYLVLNGVELSNKKGKYGYGYGYGESK